MANINVERIMRGSDVVYDKLEFIDHLLKRPDMIVGTVYGAKVKRWCFIDDKLVYQDVIISQAMERAFLEIILNSADNIENSKY